jgi:adenine phosphoribosyltransferase
VAVGNDSARQDSLAAAANPLATTSPSFNFEDYMSDLKEHIRDIADFPKPGIMFRDITPLLANPDAFREVIRQFADKYHDAGITAICAAEARGFIFATPLALELNAAFVPIRKPGKLPFDTKAFHYELEYGTDTLEMHTDAVNDLLATGGTMEACVKLCEHAGAEVVGCAFVIELTFIGGREKLAPTDCFSLISYDSED